jgi:hypothetical protein
VKKRQTLQRFAGVSPPWTNRGVIAAVLLTGRDLDLLAPGFSSAWPVEQMPAFADPLHEIDTAD